MASLMRRYGLKSSVEVHYHRVTWKYPSSSGLEKEKLAGRFPERWKVFVLENHFEPQKISLDVKTAEGEEDKFCRNI